MMTTTRRPVRRSAPARACITPGGLTSPKRADVKAGHGYYMGASSSPDFVLVLAMAGDMVAYCGSRDHKRSVMARWIFEDLVSRAGETMRKDAEQTAAAAQGADTSKAMGRLSKQVAEMCAFRVARHGAPVTFADFDRIELVVSAPSDVDVYGVAKKWGIVGDWDSAANRIGVECDRVDVANITEAGLTIESERLVRACPTA